MSKEEDRDLCFLLIWIVLSFPSASRTTHARAPQLRRFPGNPERKIVREIREMLSKRTHNFKQHNNGAPDAVGLGVLS